MRRSRRENAIHRLASLALLSLLALALFLVAPPAYAGSGPGMIVFHSIPERPAPTLDGNCSSEEYAAPVTFNYRLLYLPHFNWEPTPVRALATDSDLYLCVGAMPFGPGPVTPFVSLAFDVGNNGGRTPDADDLLFTLDQNGASSASRGNGAGGFNPDPTIAGWTPVARRDNRSWGVEFRIPLNLLGGGRPWTAIGFHVRHNWLTHVGTDYVWPYNGSWNVPNSWGEMVWMGAPTTTQSARLDVARITQGVEFDLRDRVFYDLVAGKDTLARAQLFTIGPRREVIYSACVVRQITRMTFSGPIPITVPEQLLPAQGVPVSAVNIGAAGFFNGVPVFNCWVPGTMLTERGDYSFQMEIQLEGGTRQRVDLGTRRFVASPELRLMIIRDNNLPGGSNDATWDDAHLGSLLQSLQEVQRRYPVRRGVATLNIDGFPRTGMPPGLRYTIHPVALSESICRLPSMPTGADTDRCEARIRSLGEQIRRDYNAGLIQQEHNDGRTRDRADWGMLLHAVRETMAGLSCWTDQRVAGGDAAVTDPANPGANGTATIIAHEIGHCLGRGHTNDVWEIPLASGIQHVSTRARADVPLAVSIMNGATANVDDTYFLGNDWNAVRQQLSLTREPALMAARSDAPAASSDLFQLSALVNSDDAIEVLNASRVVDRPLEQTADDPNGRYALIFRGQDGAELGRLRFTPDASNSDGPAGKVSGVLLVTPLPTGSVGYTIEHTGAQLLNETFSAGAPTVQHVSANSDGKRITLQWEANDPDTSIASSGLTYSIRFNAGNGSPDILLADGLTEQTFSFPIELMPATQQGRLTVEASDGYNTGTGNASIVIAPRPPIANISVSTAPSLVAGQPVELLGQAYDATAGLLDDEALHWSSDRDGDLGKGQELTVKLSPGVHTLTLRATAPSGLSTTTTMQVTVAPDSKGEGLPDAYMAAHPCLSGTSSSDDPDGDRLATLGELRAGTDPCATDTDSDGIGDGDELEFGGNPLDASVVPPSGELAVSEQTLDLGTCPGTSKQTVAVQAASDQQWSAATSDPWLHVHGGTTGDGDVHVVVDCTNLHSGMYLGQVLVAGGGQSRSITVRVTVRGDTIIYLPVVQR